MNNDPRGPGSLMLMYGCEAAGSTASQHNVTSSAASCDESAVNNQLFLSSISLLLAGGTLLQQLFISLLCIMGELMELLQQCALADPSHRRHSDWRLRGDQTNWRDSCKAIIHFKTTFSFSSSSLAGCLTSGYRCAPHGEAWWLIGLDQTGLCNIWSMPSIVCLTTVRI